MAEEKLEYKKPIFIKEDEMVFTEEILETFNNGCTCLQCSGCHGCR